MIEKLTIEGGKVNFTAQLNPTQVTISKSVRNRKIPNKGQNAQRQKFLHGENQVVDFELLLDATLEPIDIPSLLCDLVELTEIEPGKDEPPVVRVTWGQTLSLRATVERVDRTIDLFDSGGKPIRARVKLQFVEVMSESELASSKAGQCSPHTRRWVVESGDTLNSIASAAYEDPALWRAIADANRAALPNPLRPIPGTILMIPPRPGAGTTS